MNFAKFCAYSCIVLVACSLFQPRATSFPALTSTPTPQLTATALTSQTPIIATLATKSDFQWEISIIQDGTALSSTTEEISLQKAPFTIQLAISKPVNVYMNADSHDRAFKQVTPGMYANDECEHGFHTFCNYFLMMGIPGPGMLILDEQFGYGLHPFTLDPDLGLRGGEFTIDEKGIVYERYISSNCSRLF